MRNWLIAGSTVIVIAVAAWYWWRDDAALAKAKELQAQLAALGENANWEDRRALREQMRAQMDQLTDEQRRALFQELRAPFQDRMRAAVDGYFALPDAQRKAYLDQRIREMEQRRKEMEQRLAQRPANRERRGPGGPRDASGPGGRERGMLDGSSPEDRAKSTEYFSALEKRRKELGLPDMPFGGR